MAEIMEVGSSQFDQLVLQADAPALVEFYAQWSEPCNMMVPMVNKIADRLADSVLIFKVDADKSPELASRYSVLTLPTFILFKDGEKVMDFLGKQHRDDFLTEIEQLLEEI